MEEPKDEKAGEAEIEWYSDKYKNKNDRHEKVPLSQLLTLNARYFPLELWGSRRQQKRKRGEAGSLEQGAAAGSGGTVPSGESIWKAREGHATEDLARLDRLARLEKKHAEQEAREAEAGGTAAGGSGKSEGDAKGKDKEDKGNKDKDGEEEEDDDDEGDEDDYWDDEDDYQQGGHFDDDEGYDDDFGDDDGEAYF